MRPPFPARTAVLAWCCASGLLAPAMARAADELTWHGEARALLNLRGANPQGPLADAIALQPGLASAPADSAQADLDLRGQWRGLLADLWLAHERPTDGGPGHSSARFNELHLSGEWGGWQWSAGKKVVSWDVGYGFRPNDVVQQETRRTLLASTPEGRPLLQLERFDADSALSLVAVQPQRLHAADDEQRFEREAAWAARGYQRLGALDAYVFARGGQHTGLSAGGALAWVATDSLELHASARLLQRHDAWQLDATAGQTPQASTPWQATTAGACKQWLVGAQWTGAAQQSLMVEAWHDGTAPSPAQWRDWTARNAALRTLGLRAGQPAAVRTAAAGNLAWQTTPLGSASLQRDNLFVRLAWQPDPWQFTLDGLVQPADHGHSFSAGLQWQGDRWRLNAAWRVQGGPSAAVLAQLPTRRTGLLAATLAF